MKARWIAGGNEVTAFFAFGNVATGVVAVGNLARGFIAIGNVAVGVVAIGNVGLGIFAGGGATIGIGMFAAAGVIALPVLDGVAGVACLTDLLPLLGVVPILLWSVLSLAVRGERPPRIEEPALVDPARLANGEDREGWVKGRLVADGTEGDGPVPLRAGGVTLTIELAKPAADELPRLARRKVLARIATEDRVTAASQSYREAPPTTRVLVARRLEEAPSQPVPWGDSQHLQWCLSWGWRVGAGVGAIAWMGWLVF